jgi:hypothetical protein
MTRWYESPDGFFSGTVFADATNEPFDLACEKLESVVFNVEANDGGYSQDDITEYRGLVDRLMEILGIGGAR